MKQLSFSSLCILFLSLNLYAQSVAVNTTGDPADTSAMMDVQSTTKGMLIPRMTTIQRELISGPAVGLLVFDTDSESFWFKETASWVELRDGNIKSLADDDDDTKVEVEKTPDEDMIRFSLAGNEHFRMEDSARLKILNSGKSVFIGNGAGAVDDLTNNNNVFLGEDAGASNTAGHENIFIGYRAGYSNVGQPGGGDSPGTLNSYIGFQSGLQNVSGYHNAFLGYASGEDNTAERNVFVGAYTARHNTTGFQNTYVGTAAGEYSGAANKNTGIGFRAGSSNTGASNVMVGNNTGSNAMTDQSVMIGADAGFDASGSGNVLIGDKAGYYASGGNKLYIENTTSNSPLIYGEFNTNLVRINGSLESGGDVLMDRGGVMNNLTRSLTMVGAKNSFGSDFARIDLKNYDSNYGGSDYVGARISSQNSANDDSGDLRFYTKESTLTQKMIITEDGNVGIGTSTPTSSLVVGDDLQLTSSSSGNAYLTIGDGGAGDESVLVLGDSYGNYGRMLWREGHHYLRFDLFNNALPTIGVLMLNANGHVGIRNQNLDPSEMLSVGDDFGSSLGGNRITIGNTSGYSGFNLGEDIDNRAFILWNATDNLLGMGTRSAATTYSQTLVLRDGKIGVKNSDPIYDLHVGDGNITALNGSNTRMVVSDNDNAQRAAVLGLARTSGGARVEAQLEANGSGTSGPSVIVGAASSHPLYIRTGNLTRMTVTTSGNVGIGTSSPTEKLHVAGNICYTGSIAACSDIRYKKDIVPLSNVSAKLASVGAYTYAWDTTHFPDKGFTEDRQLGFIAQELEQYFPELVHTDGDGYKSLDYVKMSVILLQGMKEQQQEISELRSTLEEYQNTQEGRLEKIEQQLGLRACTGQWQRLQE